MNSSDESIQLWRDTRLQLLLVIGSLTVMAGCAIAPVLPDIIHQFHFEPEVAGSLVSLHFLTVAISVPLFGILADSVGAIPVMVPSLVLYSVFGLSGVAMNGLIPLMVTRVLLGIATGGLTAASLGLLGKLYRGGDRTQVLAYASSAISLANIVYPLLAGGLGSFHWQWAFYLYVAGIPLAGLALLVFRSLPTDDAPSTNASDNEAKQPSGSGSLLHLLRRPQILGLLLALGVTSATVYACIIYIPLYMRTVLGAETLLIGLVLASKAMGATLVSAFGVRQLIKAWGHMWTMIAGFSIVAVALITFPNLHQLALIVPTAILLGIGFGIVLPNFYGLLADRASVQLQSSILAAGTGSGFLGQFLSPILLVPVFNKIGLTGVFYTAAIVGLAVGLVVFASFGPSHAPAVVPSEQ